MNAQLRLKADKVNTEESDLLYDESLEFALKGGQRMKLPAKNNS